MSFIKIILLLFISSFYLFASNKDVIKIGLLHGKTFISAKEARIGARLWLKQMEKENLGVDFKVEFYEDEKRLLEDYSNMKISSIIIDGALYYKNKRVLDQKTEYKWIVSRNDEMFERFYLIKHIDSKFDLRNLKTKKMLYKDEFAKDWISSVLNKQKTKTLLEKTKTEKATMYDVFFNKEITAVINSDLYDSMVNINPQIEDKIKIVKKSEKMFFRAIGLTRKSLSKNKIDVLKEITHRVNDLDIDSGVLSFVQIQKIFILENEDLEKLDIFYDRKKSLQ